MNRLAIVIPAYKSQFLEKTLAALVSQTSKEFNLYIGNDAGDKAIDDMVTAYQPSLRITYKRFTDNLGSTSLVQQWNRCLAMTEREEWLWVLPDDDVPDINGVAAFYQRLHDKNADVFRFGVRYVNEQDQVMKLADVLPAEQPSFEALMEKLSFKRSSSLAEYIFRRQAFEQAGGFLELPLAWGTDDLLWFRLGFAKGIAGINDARVNIRMSAYNISNDYQLHASAKVRANFLFMEAVVQSEEFKRISEMDQSRFRQAALNHILLNLQDFKMRLPAPKLFRYGLRGSRIWGGGMAKNIRRFYLNNQRIKAR